MRILLTGRDGQVGWELARLLPALGELRSTGRGDLDLSDADAIRRVEQILAELPERYRRILELRFLGSCSVQEAAQELGVTVGNAKVLQHRALRQAAAVAERMRT